ncbi:MAG TPA: WG repeat-containing protein [Pyrinomonadaceae bacterium]|nr:WG repeat-containing protein [Pyrinomonadaceae bacterium]
MKLKILPKILFFIASILLFSQIHFAQEDSEMLPIEENNLWGFVDTKGTVVIKPQFFYVSSFSDGLALVQLEIGGTIPNSEGKIKRKPSKVGYIDKTGKIVLESGYENVRDFVDGFAPVRIGDRYDGKYIVEGKYGFIDKTGKIVIEPQFDSVANYFSEDLMAVKINKKWGFIDRSRKIVIPPQFDSIEEFSEGLAVVYKNKKAGYIDKTGKFVIEPQFFRARKFSDGMAQVETKQYGNTGYIDKTGKIVIPTKYSFAGNFRNGKVSVKEFIGSKSTDYCINKEDEKLPLKECEYIPKGGTIAKIIDGKKVFVDENGNVLFENKWDEVGGFKSGVALVLKHNKGKSWCGLFVPGWVGIYDGCYHWGYIDKTGKYIWKKKELE